MDRGIIIKNLESCGFEVFLSVINCFEKELFLLAERRFQFHFGNTAGNAKGYTNAELAVKRMSVAQRAAAKRLLALAAVVQFTLRVVVL